MHGRDISRRKFVGTTLSAVAGSSFALPRAVAERREGYPEATADWRKEGVLFVDGSPHAKLRNIPVHAVTIKKGFWEARRTINVNSSIPSMEKLLEANGRMTNFLRLAKQSDAPQQGPVYSDSD